MGSARYLSRNSSTVLMRVTGEAGGPSPWERHLAARRFRPKGEVRGPPPGSADVPVGSNFSPNSRPNVLKPNAQLHPPSRGMTSHAAARGPFGPARRSEVRSTRGRAAARDLAAPCEVRGPLWVGCSSMLEDVEPADEGRLMIVGCG